MTRAATIRRQCPHTGNWITGPAHLFAPPRVKASDIAKHGSFAAAREELSRRLAAPAEAPNAAFEARGGKAST